MFRKLMTVVPIGVLLVGGSTACATKGFVRTNVGEAVGEVNEKVDSLGRTVEETQERTRQNEGRIAEVDQRAAAAAESAEQAGSAAAEAANTANAAAARADAVDQAQRRMIFEVVLSEDQGNFGFGATELPDAAKARLDELITQLQSDPQGAYFEIEGHTDNVGPNEVNERIGLERAEAVKRYLYQQHQIPLHRINVISYGEEMPVGPNETREGRAQNRRVVIRVLV